MSNANLPDNRRISITIGTEEAWRTARFVTEPYYQFDYGHFITFYGITLPEEFEVHLSNSPAMATARIWIGTNNTVVIDDRYFEDGRDIYGWLYAHPTDSSGITEYPFQIPIIRRSKPSSGDHTPHEIDIITEAIAAMNGVVEEAQQYAEEAAASVAHYPEIHDDGYWYAWEGTEFVSTGTRATGPTGATGPIGATGAPGEMTASSVAPVYSAQSTYAKGDYCVKDGQLYTANQDISTAEAWTAAHWTATSFAEEFEKTTEDVSDLKGAYQSLGLSVVDGKLCMEFEEVVA